MKKCVSHLRKAHLQLRFPRQILGIKINLKNPAVCQSPEEGSSNGHPLLLPPRQFEAALAHHGLKAQGHRLHRSVQPRHLCPAQLDLSWLLKRSQDRS